MALTRNLALRATAELFAKGGSVLLMVLAARMLGREAFGSFSIAWATGWLLATAADLGLHLIAVREAVRGERPARSVVGAAIAAKVCLTALSAAILAAAAPVIETENRLALWAVSGALVALSWVDLAQHLLRARGAFARDAAAQIAARAAFLVGGLVGLFAGGLAGLGIGLLAGAVVGAAGALMVAVREYDGVATGREAWGSIAWILRRSLPLGAGVALTVIYFRIDLFLLDLYAGAATVGTYASAYRVFESAQLLPAVSMTVLFPRLAATAGDEDGGLRMRALAMLGAVGVAVACVGAVVARPVVTLLYGEAFASAAEPLRILFWAVPLMFANFLLTQDLVSHGRQARFAVLAGLALAFNLAANLVAIPRYGVMGAAAVTIATEGVLFVGCALSLWGSRLLSPLALERGALALAATALVSLPFESDRLAVGLGNVLVTLPEALVAASILAGVAAALTAVSPREVLADRALVATAALFVLALLVSAALAPEHRGNALKFTARMAGGAAFGLVVCWLVARRAGRAAALLGAYAAGVGCAALLGVAEVVAGAWVDPMLAVFREHPSYAAGLRRAGSTYGYPNTAAAAIVTALPAVAAFVAVGRRRVRIAAALGVLALAAGLVATYSRGGLVAALVGLVVVGLFWPRRLGIGAAAVALMVAGAWGVALLGGAALANRGLASDESVLLSARLEPAAGAIEATTGAEGRQPVRVTNTGRLSWRSTADAPFVLVSRWYDDQGGVVDGEGTRTALPETIGPGDSLVVDGRYIAPERPGRFVLVWDIYIERRLRFSERGMPTGNVSVVVTGAPTVAPTLPQIAPAPAPALADVYVSPPRADLWRAAWSMFRERPLVGFGPDAYRLTYGRYLGLEKWDHRVYANNLALELLATGGLLVLVAFSLLLALVAHRGWRLLRRVDRLDPLPAAAGLAALAALVAFLVHGVIDYFLEFTAGYVAFWMLVGVVSGQWSVASSDDRRPATDHRPPTTYH